MELVCCPECGDPISERIGGQEAYHPSCCPHDDVVEEDGRDGAAGRLKWFCMDCGTEVTGEPNEDGGIDWVPLEY